MLLPLHPDGLSPSPLKPKPRCVEVKETEGGRENDINGLLTKRYESE